LAVASDVETNGAKGSVERGDDTVPGVKAAADTMNKHQIRAAAFDTATDGDAAVFDHLVHEFSTAVGNAIVSATPEDAA